MPDITVITPSIGTEAYFTFKEPINTYIKNKFNINVSATKLKIISVISMKDTIRNDLKDPFTSLYDPASISEVEYKKDLLDNVPIVSFSFRDTNNIEKFIRSPLNYIASISSISNVEYVNRLLVIDLNKLPLSLDITTFFDDFSDYITDRLGISPEIKEVSIGNIEFIDTNEHETRETIRRNLVTVYKTNKTRLEEITLKHDQLLDRLRVLNITLG